MTPVAPVERLASVSDVTAVIPAYQRVDLIGRAVLSALQQFPVRAAEVLVVDDGSTDGTGDLAERLGARVVRQVNAGEGAARNTGLRHASTAGVAFLDSDDAWLPGHLATLVPHLPGRVLVGSVARAVPSGKLVGYPGRHPSVIDPRSVIWPDSPVLPSAVLVDRAAALAVGGFGDLPRGADLEFWVRLLQTGPGLVVPTVTCTYLEHDGQVSADTAQMRDDRVAVARRFASAHWFDDGLIQDMAAVIAWDVYRQAPNRRSAVRALTAGLRTMARRPRSAVALVEALRWRAAVKWR